MNIVYDRSTLEYEKIQLQTKIRDFLVGNTPNTEDIKIIKKAMEYVVKSHHSYYEQYYQIRTFQYAIDGLIKKYNSNMVSTVTCNSMSHSMVMFDENESPF